MSWRILLVVGAFLMAGPVVVAQRPVPNVNDGQALQRECATALRMAETEPPVDGETPTDGDESSAVDPVEQGYDIGQCLGLVSAVWHTHMMMVDEFDGRAAFCPSVTISSGEMARIVDLYLQAHPAELTDWDTVLVLRAFIDAYPCDGRP